MYVLRLVLKNALRHKLRTALTIGGVVASGPFFFPHVPLGVPLYRGLSPGFVLPQEKKKPSPTGRQGAIAGRKLAGQSGGKVRDHIPLRAPFFPLPRAHFRTPLIS